uniref:Uncharacterized protein n=1 Tax=Arundo donax TaxID=35708 RepID=A0A0A9F9L3_ARUDO
MWCVYLFCFPVCTRCMLLLIV